MNDFGTAIILAGGKSTRMGFDKQLLEINQRRLMDSLVNKLKTEFDEIIIVTNKPEYYIGLSHKIITDKIVGKGPLSGIHAGLLEASSRYSFVVACDMPNVNMEYVNYMMDSMDDTSLDGCVTRFMDNIEPFISFYSKDLVDKIEKSLEQERKSIISIFKHSNIKYIDENKARKFSPNWDMFLNLNTKEDLNRYLANR